MGFTKLDEGILQSSIMMQSPEVFKVWIALLAGCKEDGISRFSAVGLASHCFLPIDVVRDALKTLSEPDEDSRSINDDGRRIRRVDGGYEILNYLKYRELSYKEKDAERKYRKYHSPEISGEIQKSLEDSASVSVSSSCSDLDFSSSGGGSKGEPKKPAKQKKEKPPFDPVSVCPFFGDDDFRAVWVDYLDVRRRKRAVCSDRAIKDRLSGLMALSGGVKALALKIVARSADKGWTDFYQLREDGYGSNRGDCGQVGGAMQGGGARAKPGEFDEGVLTFD